MTAKDVLDEFLGIANNQEGLFRDLFTHIHSNGITDELVKQINEWLALRPRTVCPQFDAQSRSFIWAFEESFDEMWLVDPSVKPEPPDKILPFVGWCTAILISVGVFDRLKRCEACKRFYFGGPRAKYCSDNCGSLTRVRRKREKDRIRQML